MHQAGLPFQTISDLAGIPLTTVYDMIDKYQRIGTVRTQKKGRPTSMTEQDRQELSRIITCGRRLTVAQVTNLMTHMVSTQTIQQEIHKLSKHSRIAPRKPYLQPQDFQWRLAFAQAHHHWTINEWARVIWTNESAFEREFGGPLKRSGISRTSLSTIDRDVKRSWSGGLFVQQCEPP
ncbi:hypothetical protein O181_055977 [Austropuccinia psidii MF-1]|uniref:Transposase Tc1-like domain-containing protein n=1 Tax=Austropuccinia psidii MF-1 TaxID=1389203 RepID=A0A9Q3E9X9_9BASI|nr:hypothetical protein [Austropuccinia psidii MF-1]